MSRLFTEGEEEVFEEDLSSKRSEPGPPMQVRFTVSIVLVFDNVQNNVQTDSLRSRLINNRKYSKELSKPAITVIMKQ